MFIPFKAYIAGGALVAAAAGVWFYGETRHDAGVRKATAAFVIADQKGSENVNETAEKTLSDIGDDPDVDELLRSTNGFRD